MTPPTPATKLTISRRFSREGEDPLGSVAFEQRRAVIYNADGSVNFEMSDLEVPVAWDQTACDILASKYLRKTGVPQHDAEGGQLIDADGNPVLGPEHSARQWALRLANAWAIWGERGGYFAGPEDVSAFRDEMVCMLITQMGSPNSPQHFNTGLYEAYGIVGDPEGNWYYDETDGEVKLSPHRYFRSACSACYIQSVEDALVGENSIFDLAEREARLFKAGSGTGTNFSSLRAKGEKLSGGGTSSGVLSFMRILDRAAGSTKSGGTTRRAAKLVALDCDHPEIEEFVNAKVLEEKKVAALIAGGFDPDWSAEGGAHDTVSFQNANHSVRIGADFLDAVADDADWELTERTTGAVMRTIKARGLWEQIAEAAWRCADPGVQFDDIINDWNTAANDGRLRATNPCCLVGETSVLTEEGWIPIATLAQLTEKGRGLPRVRTYDPATGTFVWAVGTRAWKAGETSALACVTTSGGLELVCTPDHHVLTADQSFVAAGHLCEGRGLLSSRQSHQVAVVAPFRPTIPSAVYDLEVPGTHTFVVGAPGLDVVVGNSEFTHLDDTACNLASLNLVTFFDDQTGFDVDAYLHAVRLWTIVLEISVSMAHYPSATLAKNSYEQRTLGLGYANLGALLMRAGLPYDSDEGRAVMGALTALLHDTAYATSSELAAAAGPCAAYERNAGPAEKVIRNHARAAYGSRLSESDLGAYEDLHVVPVGIDHAALRRT
jgi:ribonucleotide reductase alpha subunit